MSHTPFETAHVLTTTQVVEAASLYDLPRSERIRHALSRLDERAATDARDDALETFVLSIFDEVRVTRHHLHDGRPVTSVFVRETDGGAHEFCAQYPRHTDDILLIGRTWAAPTRTLAGALRLLRRAYPEQAQEIWRGAQAGVLSKTRGRGLPANFEARLAEAIVIACLERAYAEAD